VARLAHLHLVVAVEPWLHTTWPRNCCSLHMPRTDLLRLHRARQAAGNHHRSASRVVVAVAGFVSIHRHHTNHPLGCLFLVSGSLSPINMSASSGIKDIHFVLATYHCIDLVHDRSLCHLNGLSGSYETYLAFNIPTGWLRYVDLAARCVLHFFDRFTTCCVSVYFRS
jgi:hypothetical protein